MQKIKAYGRCKYNYIETKERKKFFGDVSDNILEITKIEDERHFSGDRNHSSSFSQLNIPFQEKSVSNLNTSFDKSNISIFESSSSKFHNPLTDLTNKLTKTKKTQTKLYGGRRNKKFKRNAVANINQIASSEKSKENAPFKQYSDVATSEPDWDEIDKYDLNIEIKSQFKNNDSNNKLDNFLQNINQSNKENINIFNLPSSKPSCSNNRNEEVFNLSSSHESFSLVEKIAFNENHKKHFNSSENATIHFLVSSNENSLMNSHLPETEKHKSKGSDKELSLSKDTHLYYGFNVKSFIHTSTPVNKPTGYKQITMRKSFNHIDTSQNLSRKLSIRSFNIKYLSKSKTISPFPLHRIPYNFLSSTPYGDKKRVHTEALNISSLCKTSSLQRFIESNSNSSYVRVPNKQILKDNSKTNKDFSLALSSKKQNSLLINKKSPHSRKSKLYMSPHLSKQSIFGHSTKQLLDGIGNMSKIFLNKEKNAVKFLNKSHSANHVESNQLKQQLERQHYSYASAKTLDPDYERKVSLGLSEMDENGYIKLLRLCKQAEVLPFSTVFDWSSHKIKKIGEGAFGEVYTINKYNQDVIKVIPLSDNVKSPGCLESKSVVSEIIISKSLSRLVNGEENQTRCFSQLIRSYFVKGSYPTSLLEAWDQFNKEKKSDNLRPELFPSTRHYIILVYEHAGKSLDSFKLKNACEAVSVFKQVVISLAIGELTYNFEHRDLHVGNILIKRNRSKLVHFKYHGKDVAIESEGLQATIIDYTFSRLITNGYIYFHDLSKEESLFEPSEEIQFITYEKMRAILSNQWNAGNFESNVLWLHYLIIVLQNFNYINTSSNKHHLCLNKLKCFEEKLTTCNSAQDFLSFLGIFI